MKLPEHVDQLRTRIENTFDKEFARLGLGERKKLEIEKLPEEIRPKRLRFEEILQSHIGEVGGYEEAREKLIEELTFTLFNRLASVKVMEAAAFFPPVLTKQTEHGDRSFGHKAWLEANPDMRSEELEGIRKYIIHTFDELGTTLPLFSRDYPYALLPDTISLNEIIDAFNAVEKDPQVGPDIWQSDDVLGWMYEAYNAKRKEEIKEDLKVRKIKYEYDRIHIQSCTYTPRWVVQFLVENSLGKLYLEMYPDSEIGQQYKIANAPKTRVREPKPLHEIKMIDPASGSGNFILYGFDFFYALYQDQIENYGASYDEKEVPRLIIEHNLHGIDLDDRAVQLAQLGLYIKARKKRRNIGALAFNVVSSDFFLPDYEAVKDIFDTAERPLSEEQRELVENIWSDLQQAYRFGSLIRVGEKVAARLENLVGRFRRTQMDMFAEKDIADFEIFRENFFLALQKAVAMYAQDTGNSFLSNKTRDAITFLRLLTLKYDVATANPPYTDSADFGPELKTFIGDNYKKPYKFHSNLYATFIKRCYELTGTNGKIAMIHPHTFMFIKTFEDVRKFMIEKCHIDFMVDLGLDRVNLFGPGILLDATFYILSKGQNDEQGVYFNLTTNLQEKFKKGKFLEALEHYISGVSNDRVYTLEQSKLKIIKSWPFIYWISDEFREKFGEQNIDNVFDVAEGLKTGNNFKYLRFWYELTPDFDNVILKDEWIPYAKGGPFKKHAGNLWTVVKFRNNGQELASDKRSALNNSDHYFKKGITFTGAGSKGNSFRFLPEGSIFDTGSRSLFPKTQSKDQIEYLQGYLNSKLASNILDCLNPTVNTTVGDLKRVPYVFYSCEEINLIGKLSRINIDIVNSCDSYTIINRSHFNTPFANAKYKDGKVNIKRYFNFENYLLTQVLINEAIIDEKIFKVYDLTAHDKAMVLAKEGKSIGSLPVLAEARTAYLEETEATAAFPLDHIRDYIESLPTKSFTAEEQETIESGFPSLYQSNNDLEEFCIRHQVNPINIWYWFKQSRVIPKQRMHTVAMEFLVDMVREILMEDEDGIIPLVPNAGEKILLDRIEDKFYEKGFSSAQYSSFDSVLGRPIHEYLNKYFFAELSDHLNLFMYLPKTPFIWHLSSGPEQGFDCYLIIYKWSRDNLLRLRSVYIEQRERALVNRQSDLANNDSAEAQNEKDRIFRQLKEIETFKQKIDELLAEGYDPVLDDGVGKNIAPLQKKKMIPYEVLNAGQLKKYLNADW
ncbi:BREX-1 system adenine-specific DNA-methyltransferase PglX [Phaeodactylibacter xiamenensis]|uniref:BREX-1 system adenine-specific DNA-methyltransferase PglX n=1 Tax=Phaeodactylibacter xiamenensis TaxID=1524460 RepID=UPI003BABE381